MVMMPGAGETRIASEIPAHDPALRLGPRTFVYLHARAPPHSRPVSICQLLIRVILEGDSLG